MLKPIKQHIISKKQPDYKIYINRKEIVIYMGKNTSKAKDIARTSAINVVKTIYTENRYSNIVLNKLFGKSQFSSVDKSFITHLVYGTLSKKITIDFVLKKFSKIRLKKLKKNIYAAMQIAVFQILFMDRVPDYAVCNETVNIIKKFEKRLVPYANAVIRNIIRNKEDLLTEINNHSDLSIKYSYEDWIIKLWEKDYGKEEAAKIARALNDIPNMTIRTNTLLISRDILMEKLMRQGINCEIGKYSENAIILSKGITIDGNNLFNKGYFQVQDEAAMLAAEMLGAKPGNKVLDLCAAPGGKTCYIAQMMDNKGEIVAQDIHEHRLNLINKEAKRLKINIIKTKLMDAIKNNGDMEKFDCVLADVPCSGLGIIRKKPDIKWNRKESDIDDIIVIQRDIIKNAGTYVKKGGRLVYSTCTLNKSENQNIVNEFLKNNRDFNLCKTDFGYHIEMFPHKHNVDGFYIAVLKKEERSMEA